MVSPLAFTESMATRVASSRDWTCASSSKKDMVPKLTCGIGVGTGELAANDDLVRPCPVEVATDLVELAEEVVDVLLGACVQDPKVWGECKDHRGVRP